MGQDDTPAFLLFEDIVAIYGFINMIFEGIFILTAMYIKIILFVASCPGVTFGA